MDTDAIALAKKIQMQFKILKEQKQYADIAKLITYAWQVNPSHFNRQIFGYLPGIFREIELFPTSQAIQLKDVYFGEPVVYKVYYPQEQKLYNIPFFYILCYLKKNSDKLNIYFQSAHPQYKKFDHKDYDLSQEQVNFEGCVSAFNNDDISIISVSDPGQFVPGLTSSYYVGSADLNFVEYIVKVLEPIANLANINANNILLFGSSAGTFGALLSSTYFQQKVNVLAVNSQIFLHYRTSIMKQLFNIDNRQKLLDQFGKQISCVQRFKQKLNSIPNIYILANVNDYLYQRNFNFYRLYIDKFTHKEVNNQSVFDSYYGVDGHGRPESSSLKAKIKIAREVLTMNSTRK